MHYNTLLQTCSNLEASVFIENSLPLQLTSLKDRLLRVDMKKEYLRKNLSDFSAPNYKYANKLFY
jgi:hypothetical protein